MPLGTRQPENEGLYPPVREGTWYLVRLGWPLSSRVIMWGTVSNLIDRRRRWRRLCVCRVTKGVSSVAVLVRDGYYGTSITMFIKCVFFIVTRSPIPLSI